MNIEIKIALTFIICAITYLYLYTVYHYEEWAQKDIWDYLAVISAVLLPLTCISIVWFWG